MKHHLNRDGYAEINIYRDGIGRTLRVHRLVVQAFIGPIPRDLVVNHKNGERADNRICNLEVITIRENILHAWNELRRKPTNTKLTEAQVVSLRERRATGEAVKTLAAAYNISGAMVSNIASGKAWKHTGGPRTKSQAPTRSPLTDEQALELIRRFYTGESRRVLATEYGTNRRTVYNLAQGRSRAHLLRTYNAS